MKNPKNRRCVLTREGRLWRTIGLPEIIQMDILKKHGESMKMADLERAFYEEVEVRMLKALLDILKSRGRIDASDADDIGISPSSYNDLMEKLDKNDLIERV